jgi:hypothetical protein
LCAAPRSSPIASLAPRAAAAQSAADTVAPRRRHARTSAAVQRESNFRYAFAVRRACKRTTKARRFSARAFSLLGWLVARSTV